MKDNLTIRKKGHAYCVMTAVSGQELYVGTKKQCEKYLETFN